MQIIVIIYVQTLKSTLIVHFEISNKHHTIESSF